MYNLLRLIKRIWIKRFCQGHVKFYRTVTGNYFLPVDAPDDIVINAIKSGKVFDHEVVEIASAFIKENTVVLDIGANFGQMSILFGKMVGDGGKVYSFEADAFALSLLKRNIAANDMRNIEIVSGAVFDCDGIDVYFPEPDLKKFGSYGSYGVDPRATSGRKVKTLTVDSLNITIPISFMKVDVQGSDLHAMLGARRTIERHRMPILFEFEQIFQSDFNTNFQQYVEFVASIGYVFDKIAVGSGLNFLIKPRY